MVPGEVIRGGISEEGRGSGRSPEVFKAPGIPPCVLPPGPADAGRRSPAGRGRAARPASRAALILKRTIRQLRAAARGSG